MDIKGNKLVLDPASKEDSYLIDFMRRGLESRERWKRDERTVGEDNLKTRVIRAAQEGSSEVVELSPSEAGVAATASTIELERMSAGAMYKGEWPDGMGAGALVCRWHVLTLEEFSRGQIPLNQE